MTHVRPLLAADVDWAAGLGAARREHLAAHAPRFWRPASDATARHRAFLARAVDDDRLLTLRSDHGYLVAAGDGVRRVVDDAAMPDALWPTEGVAVLRAARATTQRVRLAVPVAEVARRDAAESLGLRPVETWWHRDLPLVQVRGEGGRVELATAGGRGRLVPAPPVHDPGGSVLLVSEADSADALTALEAEAAERGATVAVVTHRADDLMRELVVVESGYVRTTVFFETIDG